MVALDTKVTELNKVGKVLANRLKHLGIETTRDLIFYYPFRYDDFSQMKKIKDLQAGQIATVKCRVDIIANRRSPRKRKVLTEAVVSDESGEIKAIWFNQPWIGKNLKAGDEVYLSGKLSGDLFNVYFNSPNYEKIATFANTAFNIHTARLVPIYPLTEGISQKQIRFLIKSVLPLTDQVEDFLPDLISKKENLWSLARALKAIHFPQNPASLKKARDRLAFDELFLIQLFSQKLRQELNQAQSRPIKFFEAETKEFVSSLDFSLTLDQKKAAWEIIQDLTRPKPMNRLLNGEVGSGKTVVAAIAAYNVALNGGQTVLLAPTEILASQHFKTLNKIFPPKIKIGLITRSQWLINDKKISKKEFLSQCQNGKIDIIIGTHAVIQKAVAFQNLVLIVIDEQHRFGVEQRQSLKQKQKGDLVPHFLSLSATPIPRSLALTIYGDLDLSIIREMPKGRKVIITKNVPTDKRQLTYNFINEQIRAGRQVFVICPLIDPSDKLGRRSVTQEFEKLDKQIFPYLKIGLLHGRLKSKEKEETMKKFLANEIKILVATSMVEVGVDAPNASVIMIEGAERFGLAQLHQFRGRVGRSQHQSYCFLFSDQSDLNVLSRLEALVGCHDGFALAQKDLELRGAGEIFGYEQSGFSNLKIANLNDLELAKRARERAEELVKSGNLDSYTSLKVKLNSLDFISHLE